MTLGRGDDVVTATELRAFGFTDDLVDRIMRFLDSSATDLNSSKPTTVVRAAFGQAPASIACAGHAGKARQHVVDAINDMVTGLHGYHSSLDGMRRRAHDAEDTSTTDLTKINKLIVSAEDCAAAPTVGSPSQCVAPGEDS